jgi:large subunit ribosomal protein L24
MHVKKGDNVVVIAGNDKGKEGEVVDINTKRGRVIVAGINIRTKHEKPTQQNPQGERVQREFPIHHSNVMLVDPSNGKPTRKRPQTA